MKCKFKVLDVAHSVSHMYHKVLITLLTTGHTLCSYGIMLG